MTTTSNDGKLLARSGLGSIQAALWRNEHDNGASQNVSLSKSFFDRNAGELKRQTVSLSPTEVSTAIDVLDDIRAQMLVLNRRHEEAE